MKIKHFQGYGTVNAKKTSLTENNGTCTLKIHVEGNHECGLIRDDIYDLANWLIKRFDKTFTDYRSVRNMTYESGYKNGIETCDYTFEYEKEI